MSGSARAAVAVLLLALITSTRSPTRVAAQPDVRFGAVEAFHAPAAASQAGVAWERVRFHWAQIQAGGEGSWDDGELTDEVIGGELAAGRQLVGLLIGIPAWAAEDGLPRGLDLPHTDPGNTWATFVRTVVGRYAGRIDHWILWNEPDVWDPSHPGHTWNGSVADFLQLTRVGYVTAKETNPSAVVHLAAVTHWWDAAYGRRLFLQRFLEALTADSNAAGNGYYFDVATLHLYFQPQFVYDLTSYYYGLMGSYGIWKPIWIVETNAAPSTDPAWPVAEPRFRVSLEEQAAYIPQALALGLAAGAQRIGIYKLIDTPGDAAANPEPFGLVRADGSRRPAFTTFQVAVRLLAGATQAVRGRWDDVGEIRVDQSGGTTTVLFTRVPGPRTVQLPALAPTAVLVDMWGNRRSLTTQDGLYTVELPAAPCLQSAGEYCIIGGPTFYLIQGEPASVSIPVPVAVSIAGGSPTGAPPAGPSASATAAPAVMATAAPSATASAARSATATDVPSATATDTPPPTASATPTPTPAATASWTPSRTPSAAPAMAPTVSPTITPTAAPTPTRAVAGPRGASSAQLVLLAALLLVAAAVALLVGRLGRRREG